MTYSVTEQYGEKTREGIKRDFLIKSLNDALKYAHDDIRTIEKYIVAIKEQIEIAKVTQITHEVVIWQEKNYAMHKIQFRVWHQGVVQNGRIGENRVTISGYEEKYPYSNKTFDWKTRKDAAAYAEELSQKYGNCPITGNAAHFLIKPKKDVIQI